MAEPLDEIATDAFRPHRKPVLVALVANVALFSALVVFPYVRGQLRAEDRRERFSVFAACFWGGSPRPDPGLELPPGERERYAENVLRGPADWPERCREPLRAIAPDEPFLLFPGVKQAEQNVRQAVLLVDGELVELARLRREGIGSVPPRPHLAVGRLLASLSAMHEVADASLSMTGEAIAFDGSAVLPEPARVPLQAAIDAVVRMAPEGDGLEATALDARGISRVRVAAGRVDMRRVPRPGLVRGTVRGPGTPWIAWATSEERCGEDDHGCAFHALGLAALPDDATRTPDPRWVAGHPASRVDRALVVGEGRAWVVAVRAGEPAAEVRSFDLGAEPEPGAEEGGEAPPLAADLALPLEGFAEGSDALLLAGDPPLVVWPTAEPDGARFRAMDATAGAAPKDLGVVRGDGAFAFGCAAEGARWLAIGTVDAVRVVRIADAEVRGSDPLPLGLGAAVSDADPERDRVRITCDGEHAAVLALREDGLLLGAECDAGVRCTETAALLEGVAHVDAIRDGRRTLIAWAPRHDFPEVHVARMDSGRLGEGRIPTACWQSEEGFCGPPQLAADNGRILLATRERTDLLVVESTDGGETWRAMRGIR